MDWSAKGNMAQLPKYGYTHSRQCFLRNLIPRLFHTSAHRYPDKHQYNSKKSRWRIWLDPQNEISLKSINQPCAYNFFGWSYPKIILHSAKQLKFSINNVPRLLKCTPALFYPSDYEQLLQQRHFAQMIKIYDFRLFF